MNLRDKFSSLDVEPGKVLKIVIGLSVVLLLMWLITLSHIDYDEGPDANNHVNSELKADSSAVAADSIYSKEESENMQAGDELSGIFSSGLLTFFVLLVILIMIWLWFDRKGSLGERADNRGLKTHILGEGAQLKIIRINEEVWVIGVTSSSVNLLHRYQKDEWKEKEPESEANGNDMFRKLFKSQLM